MINKEKYIRQAKLINKIMIPNKLYNSRSIFKMMREVDNKIFMKNIIITLKYARANDIIHNDKNFDNRIIYWKKTR